MAGTPDRTLSLREIPVPGRTVVEIRRSDPQPRLKPRPSSRLLRMADIRRGRVGQPTSASCSFDPDLQGSLRHGFPPLFATGFVEDTDPVFSIFHLAERLNMIPVFRSSLFSDSQITWHRLRHEHSQHGGQQKARSHYPQPIRSITPSRLPCSSTLTATLNPCGNRAICLTII